MSLFFDVLCSINNPELQGSVAHLETLTTGIQKAGADRGIEASKLQDVLSALGGVVAPILQKQQGLTGFGQLDSVIGQVAAGGAASSIQSIFPPQLQQQIAQAVAQKTGIGANTLQAMLPSLLPAIIGILGMGTSKSGTGGSNPLLTTFLNKGGDHDLGMVFKYANRFLNPPQA
ncbi:MAG: hypothetical protein VKK04_11245 [Synechococcales bacterium]|nr:hypothetical protein [Synechococcales bacterium]